MAENNQQRDINQNTNQALFGLNTDNVSQQIKPGTLTYALNAVVESFDGNMISYQNEQSNVLCSEFKAGFRVIGVHPIIEQNRTIVFLVNPDTAESEIGEINNTISCDVNDPTNLNKVKTNGYVNNGYNNIDDLCAPKGSEKVLSFYELYKQLHPSATSPGISCCTYRTIISAPCLGFDINYPVKKMVHRLVDDGKGGTELYWPQVNYPRRFVNLDDPPFKEIISDCSRIKSGEVDCDLMEVQPVIQIPVISPKETTGGGSLTAGTYQFGIQYGNDKSDGYTACLSITNPISISKKIYGLDYNFETDKSISLEISNLDTRFTYFNLVVIKTINGAAIPEIAGTYEILKDTASIIYSGNEKTAIKLSIEDVFQKYPYYGEANKVSVVDNTIIWAGVKGSKNTSYQSVANNIKLKWETWQLPAEGYSDGINSALYRGYMRDEVYAFEFVPILRHGEQKEGFHIPNRKAAGIDLTLVDPSTNDDVTGPDKAPKWKIYNTGSVSGKHPSYVSSTNKKKYTGPYEYGEFAYWESEKTYPCDPVIWGDLAGKPIRHHKFPDNIITHIHDNNPNTNDTEFEHHIYPIGVKIDLENIRQAIIQSDLSDADKANIIGFKIIRSDRVNNKSVIAKGLLYNMGSYTPYEEGQPSDSKSVLYPNYPFNDLGDDPFLTHLSSVSEEGFNFYLLDVLRDKLDNLSQETESLSSSLPMLNAPVKYVDERDPFRPTLISISGSQVSDLQRKLDHCNEDIKALFDNLQKIEDYYNQKLQNNQPVCASDVDNLTIAVGLYNVIQTDISTIQSSDAITTFNNTIGYINNNSDILDNHSKAVEIYALNTNLKQMVTSADNLDKSLTSVQDSYNDYGEALAELSTIDCLGIQVSSSSFSKARFTFHSPDTHFFQPTLGSLLKFETLEGGSSFGNFVPVKGHAGHKLISTASATIAIVAGIAVGALFALEPKAHDVGGLSFRYTLYYPDFPSLGTIAEKSLFWNKEFKNLVMNLIPYKNYAYQYNAVGVYNSFGPVPNNGYKQREIDKAYYLSPGNQSLGDLYPINNWNRESSVFFRTNLNKSTPLLPNDPQIIGSLKEDNSRVDYNSDKHIEADILSYYASHKKELKDQYGDMYSYNTVDTGYNGIMDYKKDYTGQSVTVFGGDIFINRFGLKRKLSYFLDTVVGRPDGADIDYSNLSNIGKARYWYNTSPGNTPKSGFKGFMKSILGVPQSSLDGNTNKLFYQNGRIYLYSYGIAYFFTESEVNVDFRQAGNSTDKDYYPNVGNGIPNDWLQEINIPIVHDNYYIYNKTYSKQNKENYFAHLPLTFDPQKEADTSEDFPFRAIYSEGNKWRIYKPISYFDFPSNYGNLTGIDTINNSQLLVRFENKSFIYNALTAIQTSSGVNAYLGNENVFKSRPVDFGDTDLGFAGSQHSLLLKTEAGNLFIDAKRGAIFLVKGTSIEPISNKGLSKWLSRHLEFNISKYFPDVDTDNAFNGIGITGTWDNSYNRFLITKLDYKPKDEFIKDITHVNGKFYYKNIHILPGDPAYFCNRSWTLSYSPAIEAWVSYHSYLPNFYIAQNGIFLTGKNAIFNNQKSSIWVHNLVHTSYQRFYGKLEPYILEYPFSFKYHDEILQNVQDYTSILEYYNAEEFYEINDGVYFNKAVLYNNQQCSGILNLYPKPKGQMNLYFTYPKFNKDSKDIIYTKSNNLFNYNTFWDVVKNPNNHFPIWVESCDSMSVYKELNNEKLDYSHRSFQKTKLRAKDLKIRHINDKQDRYKFISRFVNAATQVSYK